MQGHDAVAAMHFDDGHAHFDGQKQRGWSREKSQYQQHSTERFEYTRDIDQLGWQSVLHEHALHRCGGTRELGISVYEKNQAQCDTENQQTQRLESTEKSHKHLYDIGEIAF
jgi:hypothetical protein